MKQIITVLIFCLNMIVSNGQRTRVPHWISSPAPDEYIGISFPYGGEKEAIAVAMLSYVLGQDINNCLISYMSSRVGVNEKSETEIATIFRYSGEIKYDIISKTTLENGETIVALTEGGICDEWFDIYIEEHTNIIKSDKDSEISRNLEIRVACLSIGEMLSVTVNSENDSDLKITAECLTGDNIRHLHLYPVENESYKYIFDDSVALSSKSESPDAVVPNQHGGIPLGGIFIYALSSMLVDLSNVESLKPDSDSNAEWGGSDYTKSNRHATPIKEFTQQGNGTYIFLIDKNL